MAAPSPVQSPDRGTLLAGERQVPELIARGAPFQDTLGVGVASMRERLQLLGRLEIESAGLGTTIRSVGPIATTSP